MVDVAADKVLPTVPLTVTSTRPLNVGVMIMAGSVSLIPTNPAAAALKGSGCPEVELIASAPGAPAGPCGPWGPVAPLEPSMPGMLTTCGVVQQGTQGVGVAIKSVHI